MIISETLDVGKNGPVQSVQRNVGQNLLGYPENLQHHYGDKIILWPHQNLQNRNQYLTVTNNGYANHHIYSLAQPSSR